MCFIEVPLEVSLHSHHSNVSFVAVQPFITLVLMSLVYALQCSSFLLRLCHCALTHFVPQNQLLKECDPTYCQLFAPLIAELNELALTGIEVSVDGNVRQVYAGLATFSADNLTAHTIAGFQRHFSSGRICRYCLVNYNEMCLSFAEDAFCLRTK